MNKVNAVSLLLLIISGANFADDAALVDYWSKEPAPLLPLLHAFHDRDGYLSDDALRVVSG